MKNGDTRILKQRQIGRLGMITRAVIDGKSRITIISDKFPGQTWAVLDFSTIATADACYNALVEGLAEFNGGES